MEEFKIISTPEWDALHAFDAENNVEPGRTIAERIASEHGFGFTHPLVDQIAHAIEDAREIGTRRGPLETVAKQSTQHLRREEQGE